MSFSLVTAFLVTAGERDEECLLLRGKFGRESSGTKDKGMTVRGKFFIREKEEE